MHIPASPRVIYAKHPLTGVACQLNFPPILQIETEVPAAFQERIRQQYMVYEPSRTVNLPPELINIPLRGGSAQHRFLDNTPDSAVWSVTLTPTSLAMSTTHYERWEYFRQRFADPLAAFIEIYKPAFFTRVGLRYQNTIRRSNLGIKDVPWSELLHPYIAGILPVVDDEQDVEAIQTVNVLKLDEDRKVRLGHGMLIEDETSEPIYIIDNDLYSERKLEIQDAGTVLDSLNGASGNLFRWCITERLHNALEPGPVEQLG
jgi:uncharacterized protein (TIGR04255 family)